MIKQKRVGKLDYETLATYLYNIPDGKNFMIRFLNEMTNKWEFLPDFPYDEKQALWQKAKYISDFRKCEIVKISRYLPKNHYEPVIIERYPIN